MKKIKTLMPLLGVATVAGCTLPMVGCTIKNDGNKPKIYVANVDAETYDVKVTAKSDTAEIGKDLDLELSWQAVDDGAYYVSTAGVVIGDAVLAEYSKIHEPNGFQLKDYKDDGVTMHIPGIHIKDDTPIQIILDLKRSKYDEAIKIKDFEDSYISLKYGEQTLYKYDVLRSVGHYDKVNPDPKESFLTVSKGEILEMSFNLEDFKTLDPERHLWIIMGYWNPESGAFQPFAPELSNCDYMWYGEGKTPLICRRSSITTAYEVELPIEDQTWGETGSRKTIFFKYRFQESHSNYFQIMIGQEHQN
ncbi:MAG: hypothetical protein KBS35_00065 [Mycoplasma sp.]|nr:hypothetical protein [Candidatus Hennigella equi]